MHSNRILIRKISLVCLLPSFAHKTNTHFPSMEASTAVVPNRGAVKRCQGCRQILNLQPFLVFFTTKSASNCHFSLVRVPPNFFSVLQGAANQKRLKNTVLCRKRKKEVYVTKGVRTQVFRSNKLFFSKSFLSRRN
jgi:hypothetical protein